MPDSDQQLRAFAVAIFEIRVLLAGYLGSQNPGDMCVRQAAHLAYAFHNEAQAILDGQPADLARSLSMVRALDAMLDSNFAAKFGADLPA